MATITTTTGKRLSSYSLFHLALSFMLGALVMALLMVSLIVTSGAANASVTLVEVPQPAYGHPVVTPDVRVVHALRLNRGSMARLQFKTSDGAVYIATPCKAEDSRNCWWDAERRGNHLGTPVVKMAGITLLVKVAIR